MAQPEEREDGSPGQPIRWRRRRILRGELVPPVEEQPTEPMVAVRPARDEPSGPRMLGSTSFFRLWLAQVVSSLGDWIGLVAVLSLAARVGGSSPEAAIGVVMSARMLPGFFFGSVAGVLVDRWDRKRVMVTCDIGRGFVMATLPFINSVWGLFLASLALEGLTLLWSPAKEASVPNLVETRRLTTANSLSLAAAYGTFPVGSLLFASLTKVAEFLGNHAGPLNFLELNQESLAIYVDVITFFASAALIATLALPRNPRRHGRIDLGRTFTELKEGWAFIGTSPVIRAVLVGLGTGLIGGGMVAPLGPTFATRVLHAGPAGFGLLLTSLGVGIAIGVVGLSAIQKHVPHDKLFAAAVLGAGACLLVAASMSRPLWCMLFIAAMGVCAGASYVLGFTLMQAGVGDELRGRIFATFYTLSRLCLLISLTLAPLAAGVLDEVSGVPGVRVTLWIGASIIILAGVLAARTLKGPASTVSAASP